MASSSDSRRIAHPAILLGGTLGAALGIGLGLVLL
jgi:hypothetical protein